MRRALLFVVVLGLLIGGAVWWERDNFLAPGPSATGAVVLIEPGDHASVIAQKLQEAGVVENATLFNLGLRLRGQQSALKAGEYWFPAHVSMASAAGIMIGGKSILHKLTAAEGLTSNMIYDLVRANRVLTGDPGPVPQEGSLLPETYLFTRGMTRAHLLSLMHQAQVKFLNAHWAQRASNLPYTTPQQVLVLASIVEKETALASERRHVASVFVNRLRLGMKLESDPTIIYGITQGYPLGRRIYQSEITARTPYNTYVIAGLPPAPICNPGKDSILAVLNPANSNDLYFVANGTGGHAFAATLDEQNRNVARWRAIHNPPPPARGPKPSPKRHRR